MKSYLMIGLFLLSEAPLACEKIDYVEVKDWSLEQVEKAYCKDFTEFVRLLLTNSIQNGSQYAPQLAPDIQVCETQVKLYRRVLENVHKRPAPICPPSPPKSN